MKAKFRLDRIDHLIDVLPNLDAGSLERAQTLALLELARLCITESHEYHDEQYEEKERNRTNPPRRKSKELLCPLQAME